MSDLISREAVLESLKTDYSLIMFDSYDNLTFAGERIIEAIKRVPSVEPEKCGDCISRQAVLDRINKLIEVEKKQGTDDWGYGRERVNAYEAMLHMVKNEYLYSSVEPERKLGKWLKRTDKTQKLYGWYQCSQCGAIIGEPVNYCSECGSYNGGTE